MKKDLLYVSGKLFKKADIDARLEEGKKIRAISSNIDVYNPIENELDGKKRIALNVVDLFLKDTNAVLDSKYIFAELDDEDPGVMAELAIAWTINHIRDFLKNNSKDDFLKKFPRKDILCHLTDIRYQIEDKFKGIDVPVAINQFIVGMIKEQAQNNIYQNKDDLYKKLKGLINGK